MWELKNMSYQRLFDHLFCDKEVCAPITLSEQNKSCRNYLKHKTAMTTCFLQVYGNF